MATFKTLEATDSRPPLNATNAGHLVVVPCHFDIAVDNSGVVLATDDVVQLASVPAGHVLVDAILDTDAIASAVVDIGYADGTGDEIIDGQAITTAGIYRASKLGVTRPTVNKTAHRIVQMKLATGSAATTGAFRVTLMYRAAHFGI